MRRFAIVLGLALFTATGLTNVAHAAVPRAGVPRVYEGKTSQDKRLLVGFVKRADDSLGLKLVDLRLLILTCSVDATTERWGVGIYIGGRGWDLDGRKLDVAENDGVFALTMQAKVKATTIDGTLLRFSHAALTADEEPQICTTGDLTWSAQRTVPPAPTMRSLPGPSTRHHTTIVRRFGHGVKMVLTRLG
jgi:hypothetical protein